MLEVWENIVTANGWSGDFQSKVMLPLPKVAICVLELADYERTATECR